MPPQDQQQQGTSGLPPGVAPLVMEQFGGMNTLSARVSVPDKQVYFLDGFMPLAPGRLRTLPDNGPVLFPAGSSTIFKLFTTAEAIWSWTADGNLWRYDIGTMANSLVVAALFTADPTTIGACSIPGTEDVIFVQSSIANGYYIYSGGIFYNTGGASPYGTVPAGIKGSTVELYSSHVWVSGGGPVILASAPGSYVDFNTATGGVQFTSPDSFLKGQYTVLKSAGGFLYCFGDSSVSYISGVQTSGITPTTTFTYQNADTTIGISNWNDAIISTGRDLLFANVTGIYRLKGGSVTKVSYELDGFYGSVGASPVPQFAQTVLFGRRVWMLLARVTNPVDGATNNRLLMWNGEEWFTTLQSVTMTFITTLEVSSSFAVVGTNGTAVYFLLATPSFSFVKTVQSKFWAAPEGYQTTKAASRFWALGKWIDVIDPDLTVLIENENSNQTYTIAGPTLSGYFATAPTAIGQQGTLIGMTISTSEPQLELNSALIAVETVQYRG